MKRLCLLSIILVISCATFASESGYEGDTKVTSAEIADIYEQGNTYFKAKQYQKAIDELSIIIDKHRSSAAYEPALYIVAFSYYKLDNFKKASQLGEKFIKEFPNSQYILNVTSLCGESFFKLGEDYKSTYYLISYYIDTEDTTGRKKAFKRIMQTLPNLEISELEKLHRAHMTDPIDEHILYYLAQIEAREGKKKEAERDFNLLLRRYPKTKYTFEVKEYQRFIDLGEATGRAGILIPVTGEYANFGQDFLKIIKTYEKEKSLPFSLHYLDTKSDPIEATMAASKLITDFHVDFLIAPIRLMEAFGVCGLAYGKGIPVILPMTSEARLEKIPLVITTGQSNEDQARCVAQYAMYNLSISRFAVLFPDVAKYRSIAQAFADEVTKNSREVLTMVGYDPDSITLKWECKAIKDKNPQAIFLPMDREMVINTTPQIAYYGLEHVQILGIETFNDEKVTRLGEKYVEGAVFAASAPIDSLSLKEFNRQGFEEDDLSAKFYYTLWRLKGLTAYNRNNLSEQISIMLKGREVFNIYQIKNGEFVKVAEIAK
jgi:outer membrane protein assembly factor BamD (BamD/ComL family)/ABC-type branched-subunit amino acid transport system substrate-binding protein